MKKFKINSINSILNPLKILNFSILFVLAVFYQQSVQANFCKNQNKEDMYFTKRHLPTKAKVLARQGYSQLSSWESLVLIEKTKEGPRFNIDILNSITDLQLKNWVLGGLKNFEYLDIREIYIQTNSFCSYSVKTPIYGEIQRSEISFLIHSHFVDSNHHQISRTLSRWEVKPLNSTLVFSGKIIISSEPDTPWIIKINGYDDNQWIERLPRSMVIGGTTQVLEYVKLYILTALKSTLPAVAAPPLYKFLDIKYNFQNEESIQAPRTLL